MKTLPRPGSRRLVPLLAILGLAGCAAPDKASITQTASAAASPTAPTQRAEPMPAGRTHGLPSVSATPAPAWYAERYSRARGVGEALRRNHVSIWDHAHNAYGYYVGGEFYARYQPWEHSLEIRSDAADAAEPHCRWDAAGTLSASPAGAEDTCLTLLDELDRRLANTGAFPPVGAR